MTSIATITPLEPVEQESVDASLRRRAARVIPGGLWGHMNAARMPDNFPQFFARARGCRLWDVDGNEYLDFMCSYGPMILGYGDEEVERAAAAQRAAMDIANGPAPCLVELAELVVDTIPHADWVIFAKNGTDATTACVTLARAGTGRRKVLVARGAYHGAVPWCTPSVAGVTAEDRAHLLHFDYNDVASLEAAVGRGRRRSGRDRGERVPPRRPHRPGAGHARIRPGGARAVRSQGRGADPRRRPRRLPPASRRQLGTARHPAGPVPPGARRSPTAIRSRR